MHLSGHGGTQDGVLGALAAVGLHLSGNDGLFITLPGLYALPRETTIDDLRARIPLDLARDGDHQQPGPGKPIELGDWVRPVWLERPYRYCCWNSPRERPDGRRGWRTAPRAVVKQY